MSVMLKTRQVGDVAVIDVSGRMTLSQELGEIRDEVRDLAARGTRKILVNLGAVTYIDSAGIGELAAAYTTILNAGGTMKLLSLTKRVSVLLQITNVFELYEDEAQAVRSFE